METTYWLWNGAIYRLHNGKIPDIWNAQKQGWQLSNVLMGLIVGGDPTLDQVTSDVIESLAPGATNENAKRIKISQYPVP